MLLAERRILREVLLLEVLRALLCAFRTQTSAETRHFCDGYEQLCRRDKTPAGERGHGNYLGRPAASRLLLFHQLFRQCIRKCASITSSTPVRGSGSPALSMLKYCLCSALFRRNNIPCSKMMVVVSTFNFPYMQYIRTNLTWD